MINEVTLQIKSLFQAHRSERRAVTDKSFQDTLNNLNSRNMLFSSIAADNFATLYSNEFEWRISNSWTLAKEYFNKHNLLFCQLDLEIVKLEIGNSIKIEKNDLINHAKSSLQSRRNMDYQKQIETSLARASTSSYSKICGELSLYKRPDNTTSKLHNPQNGSNQYIAIGRIEELKSCSFQLFDLSKLIKLCEEVNIAFENECYLTIPMILRTILNHIPPIFKCQNFSEVANNYGAKNNKSFKKSMKNLENSLKNIADIHLHKQIKKKETLPNFNQINFMADIDLLLSEIISLEK